MPQIKKKIKPSSEALLVATTGAVLIVTRDGSVALTPEAMRRVAANGAKFADDAELARAEQTRGQIVGATPKQ